MYDLIVVGGGPAGLAAAWAAWEKGLRKILIVERDRELGGILNQCIHNGFGLHHFKEELTGPEYAGRFISMIHATGVEIRLDTMVLEVTRDKRVCMVGKSTGYREEQAKTVVLAMGCRERTRGAIAIPGTRPAGIFTAGAAQRYVNMEGWLPGKRVVILGSGDIGLIMARRMTLEGAKVLACVEVMPYSGGLSRNIVQCLQDFDIPLYLSHTVTEIRGEKRVEQVVVSRVDGNRRPIPGTEMVFDCDTLLLSVGLIPENELSRACGVTLDPVTGGPVVDERCMTSVPGVFACGNVLQVHDLVDYVSDEAERAGACAAAYLQSGAPRADAFETRAGNGVRYVLPQRIRPEDEDLPLFLRVQKPYGPVRFVVRCGEQVLLQAKRLRAAPGEMEKLTLRAAQRRLIDGPVTVELEELP